jgi:tetratricopeptide (TPR) repeat protein
VKRAKEDSPTLGSQSRSTLALVLVLIAGMASVVVLARCIESRQTGAAQIAEAESLYLSANTVRRMSLGFNGLVADWYWMRSLQYVGRKIVDLPDDVQLDNLGQLNLTLLAPMLETATTVDPQFKEPYLYAAVVLAEVDPERAIQIMHKGIAANPSVWRFHQHLGYIYWKQKNFQEAAATYGAGAAIPGAPPWMEAMKAKMTADGGSRDVAREIYRRMFEQAEDDEVKEVARRRLLQLDSLDQRDGLRKVLSLYKSKTGRCPSFWREIEPTLRALRVPLDSAGAPLDPSGAPYVLGKSDCEIDLGPNSLVPRK